MNKTDIKEKSKISVIIATIGGSVLERTVSLLKNSSVYPDEIIVVIPKEYEANISAKSFPSLRYEIVPFKGQVAQRAYGFKIAKYNFVLQLDDDIYLDPNCIENLLSGLNYLGPGHSVGPSIFFKEDGLTIYPSRKGIFNSFFNSDHNRMGIISKFGSAYGYDYDITNSEINSTEWLAGGCVLHHKNGLILNDFFPFIGKAYGEDLIHSVHLSNNGISLCNIKSAVCYIDKPVLDSMNYSLWHDFRSRCYLNNLRGQSALFVYIWFFTKTIINFISKIINVFSK
ncbi:glycosyltransferase [Flavobacteriaceae bacterium]|jgi:glycosyltransferase involved in cell wall biosynthesis|nr:glycosyltransferase [Flavobacteriaceae bacterium]